MAANVIPVSNPKKKKDSSLRISFVSDVFLFCFSCETVTSPGAQNRGSSAVYKSLLCSPPSVPSFMPVRGTAPLPVSVPMLSIHEGTASWEIGKQAKTDAIAQALLSPLSQQRSALSLSLSLGSPITVFSSSFFPAPGRNYLVSKGYKRVSNTGI